jgi:hypothetical protein
MLAKLGRSAQHLGSPRATSEHDRYVDFYKAFENLNLIARQISQIHQGIDLAVSLIRFYWGVAENSKAGVKLIFVVNWISSDVLNSIFRCATPDSLIGSTGSDSASAIVTKKDAHIGSEFGSLNSLNVAQEDDLDSGVGLRQQPTIFNGKPQTDEQK